MENNRDGIKEVNEVCIAVLSLTDADFGAVREMITEQGNYTHPLKNGTANKYHELSRHNMRVINALQHLQDVLNEGVYTQPVSVRSKIVEE